MFLRFANFHQHFIQSFNKIVLSLTSMLKTIELSEMFPLRLIEANNEMFVKKSGG